MPVLDVTAPDGKRIAVVFGYACHNTVLDPQDGRYCGDWAGFAQEQLEAEFPGATALFITGAAADQNAEPRYTVELSEGYGRQLADAVAQVARDDDRPADHRRHPRRVRGGAAAVRAAPVARAARSATSPTDDDRR